LELIKNMKISQLLENQDQQLDELDLGKAWQTAKNIGRGVRDAAVGVAQGVGDVGSALAGGVTSTLGAAAGGLKRGYSLGAYHTPPLSPDRNKNTDKSYNTEPAAQTTSQAAAQPAQAVQTPNQATPPAAAQPAQAPAQTTAQPAQATPPAAAQPAQAPAQTTAPKPSTVNVGQINKIIPTLRTRDLQSIKKVIDGQLSTRTGAPKQAAPVAQPAVAAAGARRTPRVVPGGKAATGAPATAARAPAAGGAVAESVGFYSKFLGQRI
jgi:hypothetical protein